MTEVLITGGAGFIGSHLLDELLRDEQNRVTCLDNLDPFYDATTKLDNIRAHRGNPRFTFVQADIREPESLRQNLKGKYEVVVHLAAKAGVRPSLLNPYQFQQVNLMGTQNLLEMAREWGTRQFVFASSSSVYGVSPKVPWSESDNVLQPISPYAVSKVAGELMGHVYSQVYGMRFIALRFFTVFGPRQRPDLAIHKFTDLILRGKPIQIYGDGTTRRDYTYVSDTVQGIMGAIRYDRSLYEIINLGNNAPVTMNELIGTLEETLGRRAIVERLPEQQGDVPQTYADIAKAQQLLGYQPGVNLKKGLASFYEWFIHTKKQQ
ncbi:MAG: GDP-mannose 4,6-dehydratase [Cytophagales bacterium]|nr:GDP-mannose 4,6-dehydratase [Cytophagales bacterium]